MSWPVKVQSGECVVIDLMHTEFARIDLFSTFSVCFKLAKQSIQMSLSLLCFVEKNILHKNVGPIDNFYQPCSQFIATI